MKNFGSSAEHGEKSCIFAAESCRSGRTGQTRNLLNPSGFRGFESLTFRKQQAMQKSIAFIVHGIPFARKLGIGYPCAAAGDLANNTPLLAQ